MPVNIYIAPTHGCFRCGAIEREGHYEEDGPHICSSCGEHSVVGFQQALDILNDFYLKGHPVLSENYNE